MVKGVREGFKKPEESVTFSALGGGGGGGGGGGRANVRSPPTLEGLIAPPALKKKEKG